MSSKWEYKVAYVDNWDRTSVEGVEQRPEEGERKSAFGRRFLNSMGADGWELVGIQHTMPGRAYYLFKRAVDDGAEPDMSVVKREREREATPAQPQQPTTPTNSDVVML